MIIEQFKRSRLSPVISEASIEDVSSVLPQGLSNTEKIKKLKLNALAIFIPAAITACNWLNPSAYPPNDPTPFILAGGLSSLPWLAAFGIRKKIVGPDQELFDRFLGFIGLIAIPYLSYQASHIDPQNLPAVSFIIAGTGTAMWILSGLFSRFSK